MVIEVLEAYSVDGRRVFEQVVVVEMCPDGRTSMKRHAAFHREHPERELGFAHTAMVELEIEERPWIKRSYTSRAMDIAHCASAARIAVTRETIVEASS